VQYFDTASESDSFNTVDPTEHYRQVVWKASTKLGCGKGKSTIGGNEGDFWVCRYGPSGNQGSQISTNVLEPIRGVKACGGTLADLPGGLGSGIGTFSGSALAEGPLPSSCIPDPILPVGALCVYGYQCASAYCCPRRKLCLQSSSSVITISDVANIDDNAKFTVLDIIFSGPGTCSDPWSQSARCTQNEDGQPFATWDQSRCGCDQQYMARYLAGTWVTLNTGVSCVATTTTTAPKSGAHHPRLPSLLLQPLLAVASFALAW